MPVQTTKTTHIFIPDGAKVSVKAYGESVYTDLGAISSAVTAQLTWTENKIESANAGIVKNAINDMMVDGAFTLINLDPEGIERVGNGIFTRTTTAASANTTIPNQIVAAGWDDNETFELIAYTSSTDSTKLRLPTKPTLTSVTLDAGGSAETLAEIGAAAAGDYMVIADSNSSSGWSIAFNSAGISHATPKTFAITIDWGSNTPTAKTTIFAGSSTETLVAYAMKITHTDSASLVRELELYSVNSKSGSFNFNFKGANEDGTEEMPLTFSAQLDTSLTDGRQLLAWSVDTGAA